MGAKGTIGIVVRVSDVRGRNRRGDRFISPDEQIRQSTGYCVAAGYDVLVIEPRDLNVSHTTPLDDRPGMGEALRLVESGALAGIGVSSQDRIGPLMLTRELKVRLLAAGAVLKVADNPTAELLDARGYLKLPSETMSLVHEAQREEIGLRWAAARRNARERGVLPRREPYGYDRDERARVVADPTGAAKIREAFALRVEGVPFAAIGARFGWSHSTTRQRLVNPDYAGADPLIPAIVTRAVFDAANAARTVRAQPPGALTIDKLVQGIARCAGCGHTLKIVYREPRKDGTRVGAYYCKNAAAAPCPDRAYVHTEALDRFVTGWFERALRSQSHVIDVVTAAADLERAQAELAAADDELNAYVENASALDRARFQRGLDARQKRVDEARDRVRECSSRVTRLPVGGSLLDLWSGYTPQERRHVLTGFLYRIDVARGASSALRANIRIFWADGTLAFPDDEARIRKAAA